MSKREQYRILSRYGEVTYGAKHMKVRLPNNKLIIVSMSPSDVNRDKQLFREFRRNGVIIKELDYLK